MIKYSTCPLCDQPLTEFKGLRCPHCNRYLENPGSYLLPEDTDPKMTSVYIVRKEANVSINDIHATRKIIICLADVPLPQLLEQFRRESRFYAGDFPRWQALDFQKLAVEHDLTIELQPVIDQKRL